MRVFVRLVVLGAAQEQSFQFHIGSLKLPVLPACTAHKELSTESRVVIIAEKRAHLRGMARSRHYRRPSVIVSPLAFVIAT
jgi:hypothetical protein